MITEATSKDYAAFWYDTVNQIDKETILSLERRLLATEIELFETKRELDVTTDALLTVLAQLHKQEAKKDV
jgi:hypothetical protein